MGELGTPVNFDSTPGNDLGRLLAQLQGSLGLDSDRIELFGHIAERVVDALASAAVAGPNVEGRPEIPFTLNIYVTEKQVPVQEGDAFVGTSRIVAIHFVDGVDESLLTEEARNIISELTAQAEEKVREVNEQVEAERIESEEPTLDCACGCGGCSDCHNGVGESDDDDDDDDGPDICSEDSDCNKCCGTCGCHCECSFRNLWEVNDDGDFKPGALCEDSPFGEHPEA